MTACPMWRRGVALLATLGLAACGGNETAKSAADSVSGAAAVTDSGPAWTPLFDPAMQQWRQWKSDSMATGWIVSGDSITKDSLVADIQTRAQFANFELEFDWKVGAMANAGVFYRVTDEYDRPYWSAPEYQLRDEALDPKGANPLLASASAYGVIAPARNATKPLGEWNRARIVVAGDSVQHWLNGEQVVSYQLGSPAWATTVKGTKFSEYPNYGLAKRGFIAIQGDHSGKLSIRGMRIRELP